MSLKPEPLSRRSANIFVNYRREDSAGYAGRLFDRLSDRFPDRVFMDVDTIEPGIDFADIIEQAVGCCEVLIVVIGREWLRVTDATGCRRLDSPNDFVRLEIAAALDRNIRIIPVLVEDAAMPRPEELPPDLVKLTRRNAIELSDVRWAFDMDRLIQAIEVVLQDKAPSALLPVVTAPGVTAPGQPAAAERTRPRAWVVLSLLALLGSTGWIVWSLASQLSSQNTQEVTYSPGPVAPLAPLQEKATEAKATEEKATEEKVTEEKIAEEKIAGEKIAEEKIAGEKIAEEKATRPPRDIAVPQPEPREPGSKTSQGRVSSLMRKGKSAVKNLRERARHGSSEKEDTQQESEKQSG